MPLKLPTIIGHRGNRQEVGYENTVEVFEHALQHSSGFETDIGLSKDNQIVIIHDTFYTGDAAFYELATRLDKPSQSIVGKKRIDEMDLSEIQQLRLINGHPIPVLDDLISLIKKYPNKIYNIELKAPNSGCFMIERMIEKGISFDVGNIFFSSFNHAEILSIRKRFPHIKLDTLFEPSNTNGCNMYPWFPHNASLYTPFSLENINNPIIRDINPEFFGLNEYDVRADVLSEIRKLYPTTKIYTWWYFSEPPPRENKRFIHTIKHLHRAGLLDMLAGVITDYPSEMTKMFEENFS